MRRGTYVYITLVNYIGICVNLVPGKKTASLLIGAVENKTVELFFFDTKNKLLLDSGNIYTIHVSIQCSTRNFGGYWIQLLLI